MFCKQCNGKMEDTDGISFGSRTPIYECVECGYTSVCPLTELPKAEKVLRATVSHVRVKEEDVLHHGIKYSDYKAVLTVKDAAGELKVEFTTYRADIITAIMKEGLVIQAFEPGDTVSIEAKPHKLMMSSALFKVNQ